MNNETHVVPVEGKGSVDFITLGSTGEIGASCHYLYIDGVGIVLDVGQHPDEDGPAGLPRFELLGEAQGRPLHHAIISHAHHDHLGALPVLTQYFPDVQVHMTPATRLLADFLLPASARLQQRRLKEGTTVHRPLFNEDILEVVSGRYQTHPLETPFYLHAGNAAVRATFYHAGHVLGAAGVLLEDSKGRRIFYTSDTHLKGQTIQPGAELPEGTVDVLLMEATLAADEEAERTTRSEEEQRFLEAIQRTIRRGGAVLIPVFALGRAQEMLALIDRFKRQGQLPEELPVYTAGSMRAIAEVYDHTRHTTPRRDPDFEVYGVWQKRVPRKERRMLETLKEPCIYLVSSGMMFERTLSNRLAQWMVEDERHSILLVGYAKEDSPAARLLQARGQGVGTPVWLRKDDKPQPVHCDVERFRFSGHSHRYDLLEMVHRLRPEKVVIVHAEEEARTWMAAKIAEHFPETRTYLPESGEPLSL